MQYQAVAAFSCLLPPSGKSRYAESVVHALSILNMYPHLVEKLNYTASFKIPPKPGDIITVHEGIYREQIIPIRGGESDTKRIIYQAATGAKNEGAAQPGESPQAEADSEAR